MQYLAVRVSEMPEPWVPSDRKECSQCHEPVWVSQAAWGAMLRDDPAMPIICTRCAGLPDTVLEQQLKDVPT